MTISRTTPIRKFLWGCCLLSLLVALFWHNQRVRQEAAHRSTEMVLDFNSLVDYARSQGLPWQDIFRSEFQPHGVQSLAFAELRLEELENYGICTVYPGVALGAETGGGTGEAEGVPQAQFTYLVHWGNDSLLGADRLLEVCRDAFSNDSVPREKIRFFKLAEPVPEKFARARIVEIPLPQRAVQSQGVCFPEWALGEVQSLQLGVWLRPENKPNTVRPEGVEAYFDRLKATVPKCRGLIFGGSSNEAVGYSDVKVLERTAELIERHDWRVGFIELPKATQHKGIETLVRKLPHKTVRVFTVPPAQQATLKPPRVAQMYGLAARERNLTLLYMRPYVHDPSPDKGFENANERLFRGVQDELRGRAGEAAVFATDVQPDRASLALLSLGGLAAFLLVINTYVPTSNLLIGLSLGLFALLNAGLANQHIWMALMALGTSCSASLLACVSQFPALRAAGQKEKFLEIMPASTLAWLRMFLLALGGALIASCFLQATTYKLGLDIFRGVKVITVIMPVVITLAWMASAEERHHWLAIGGAPLKLYQLVALGVLAVGGIVYTMRTGNMAGTDVGDSMEAERYLRMVLDQTLGVRPRFKEFLLAHPAMLMAPLLISKGWREATAVFILVGATGICGQLDTFAHIHTPLLVSVLRALIGAACGALLGWLLAAILWGLAQVAERLQKKW